MASPYVAALASDSLAGDAPLGAPAAGRQRGLRPRWAALCAASRRAAGAPSVSVGIVAMLALTACNRNASNAPAAATAATVAPTAAGTPASEAEDEGDIVLVGDADPDSGEVPLRVHFSVDAVLDEELNQPTYTWDFGDGSPPSHERNPEHTYTKPGDYLATVRVVNKTGERGWDEIDIEADAHELPAGEE